MEGTLGYLVGSQRYLEGLGSLEGIWVYLEGIWGNLKGTLGYLEGIWGYMECIWG